MENQKTQMSDDFTWMVGLGWERLHAIRAGAKQPKWATALCGRQPLEGWVVASVEEPKCKQCKKAVERDKLLEKLYLKYSKTKGEQNE